MNQKRLHIRESEESGQPDICGTAIDLINPETSGAEGISLAAIYIDPGKTSTSHFHHTTEEVYYFIEGHGRVVIDEQVFEVGPGSAIYIPMGKMHHIINDSKVRIKLMAANAPHYDPKDVFFRR